MLMEFNVGRWLIEVHLIYGFGVGGFYDPVTGSFTLMVGVLAVSFTRLHR